MVLPSTLPDPDGPGPGAWDCATCMESKGPANRAKMHCGYLPRETWPANRNGLPAAFAGEPYTLDECPGWVVRQPIVAEAAQAYAALEAGILDRFDPLRLRVVTHAALQAKRAFSLHEAERHRKLMQKARH